MERMSNSKLKDSRFALTLLLIEVVAFCPFIAKAFEGRAPVFWWHYGLRPCLFSALGLLCVGVILALVLKNRTLGIAAAIVFSIPIFALPFLETVIITAMPRTY
jgi:hypothetical protein